VVVSSALTAASAPTVGATKVDVDQGFTVTGTIPSTGTSPYQYEWLVSSGGGYARATICASPGGSGATGGALETCSIPGAVLTVGATYTFELLVNDSATTAESTTSPASSGVLVSSTLTAPAAPTVSAAKLDVNQVETVSATIPSTGTPQYSWQWMVSVNSGGFAAATQCGTNSGSGAAGGAGETCTIPGGTLTAGSTYAFELKVTDNASTAEFLLSGASPTVAVSATLTATSSDVCR
jgi:hypothetical protein